MSFFRSPATFSGLQLGEGSWFAGLTSKGKCSSKNCSSPVSILLWQQTTALIFICSVPVSFSFSIKQLLFFPLKWLITFTKWTSVLIQLFQVLIYGVYSSGNSCLMATAWWTLMYNCTYLELHWLGDQILITIQLVYQGAARGCHQLFKELKKLQC